MAFNVKPPVVHQLKCADSVTLQEGYILFSDPTATGPTSATDNTSSTTSDFAIQNQEIQITQALVGNISGAAYIVHRQSGGQVCTSTAPGLVTGIPTTERIVPAVKVYTDQSITAGDILGPQPGTYFARRGALFTDWALRARETVDRSSTNGTVLCDIVPNLSAVDRLRYQFEEYDDFKSFTTAHEGWVAIAASGTVAGNTAGSIASLGGTVLLTAQAADNASAIVHRQLVGGGYGCVTGKPWLVDMRLSGGVDTSTGWFAGLIDGAQTIAATLPIADDGTTTANDLAAFFKSEGGSTFTGITYGASTAGAAGSTNAFTVSTYYRLRILWDGSGGIQFFVNDTKLGSTVTTTTAIPASTVAMFPCFQVKNGSSTAGTMLIDYMRGVQVR